MGYSSIVSIKCDYPSCEVADEFFDSAGAQHEFLPVGWARVEFQTDVEHEDHHDTRSCARTMDNSCGISCGRARSRSCTRSGERSREQRSCPARRHQRPHT